MTKLLTCLIAATTLFTVGCASSPRPADECCSNKPEIVYVDKEVSECARSVQRVTQIHPCATCERFAVSARLATECSVAR